MFKPKVSALGTKIAELLIKEGKVFSIVPGSELATLMSVSFDAAGRDATMARDVTDINRHDVVLNKLVEMGAGAVRATIYRTRQVVRPLVDDCVSKLEAAAEKAVSTDLTYAVEQAFMPSAYENPALELVIEEYSNGPIFTEKKLPPELVPVLSGEITEWLRIGVTSLDNDLVELIEEHKGDLQSIFKTIFYTDTDNILSELSWTRGPWASLLAFALVRGIVLRKDDLESDSDALYNFLRYITAVLGSDIKRIIASKSVSDAQGLLITSIKNNTTICVNPDVYKIYLDGGGRPEAVMGAAIHGAYVNYIDIQENEDMLLDTYRRTMQINSNEILATRRSAMLEALRSYMIHELNKDDVWRGRAFELAKKVDSEVALAALDPSDPYPAVAELIARVLFPNTPCLRILKGIDTYMRNNGTLTVNEAATLTQIDYVNDWLISQLDFETVGNARQMDVCLGNLVAVSDGVIREVSVDSELASTLMKGGVELDITDLVASNLKNKLLVRM